MKNINELNLFTSDVQLNKYLLSSVQLDDWIEYQPLCMHIVDSFKNNRISLDEASKIYYEYFHIDHAQSLQDVVLDSLATFGFEIDTILKSNRTTAKRILAMNGFALEQLVHDSDAEVQGIAYAKLFKKREYEHMPAHFVAICDQFPDVDVWYSLYANQLTLSTYDKNFNATVNRNFAIISYDEESDMYYYSIDCNELNKLELNNYDASTFLQCQANFEVTGNKLLIHSNSCVHLSYVIDVLKFFFNTYLKSISYNDHSDFALSFKPITFNDLPSDFKTIFDQIDLKEFACYIDSNQSLLISRANRLSKVNDYIKIDCFIRNDERSYMFTCKSTFVKNHTFTDSHALELLRSNMSFNVNDTSLMMYSIKHVFGNTLNELLAFMIKEYM